jgi:cell division protein FtsI/penicillin-binding protein 2
MGPVKYIALLLVLVACMPQSARSRPSDSDQNSGPSSLFGQSSAQILGREFSGHNISYLLLDARTGQLLASRWENPDTPIPLGSLTKPFAALAYGQRHDSRFPVYTCRGAQTGCWRPQGHGEVDLSSAIANSCNSYFRMLTADLTAADMLSVAEHFNLESPSREISGAELAGLGSRWQVSPLRMALAYIELAHQRRLFGVQQILDGMAQSARNGTGAGVDRALRIPNALAKTGTAMCTHSPHAPGDGFTIALVPADDPKILLMVRVHSIPGAEAARIAGQMLHRIEE